MSEKRVYQDKMLNSEKEIVICNWERGDGNRKKKMANRK